MRVLLIYSIRVIVLRLFIVETIGLSNIRKVFYDKSLLKCRKSFNKLRISLAESNSGETRKTTVLSPPNDTQLLRARETKIYLTSLLVDGSICHCSCYYTYYDCGVSPLWFSADEYELEFKILMSKPTSTILKYSNITILTNIVFKSEIGNLVEDNLTTIFINWSKQWRLVEIFDGRAPHHKIYTHSLFL